MITCQVDGIQFNLRVAGVAIAGGCVLLHQMPGDAFWTLPGGRPAAMEPSAKALQREMLEETSLDVQVGCLLGVIENFFTYRNTRWHEILLCFAMDVPSPEESAGRRFDGIGDDAPLVFWWCPLTTLEAVPLRPTCLPEIIRSGPGSLAHLVVSEANGNDA